MGSETMKIEKISDTQIKFVLNQSDLSTRNIKISELAYGSEKAQELFRDMMEKAFDEYGFDADNAPLMIEAIPLASDSIMIIVTKVNNPDDIDEKFGILQPKKNNRKFKKKEGSESEKTEKSTLWVYSFYTLDDVVRASSRLYDFYQGANSLYKESSKYYLVLHKNCFEDVSGEDVECILSEYGERHISSPLSEGYLLEHGEILISDGAVEILTKHLA